MDNYRTPIFLYLSSKGLAASGEPRTQASEENRSLSRKERAGFYKNKRSDKEAAGAREDAPGEEAGSPAAGTLQGVSEKVETKGTVSE